MATNNTVKKIPFDWIINGEKSVVLHDNGEPHTTDEKGMCAYCSTLPPNTIIRTIRYWPSLCPNVSEMLGLSRALQNFKDNKPDETWNIDLLKKNN
jgi:hypothetical protein